MRTRSPACISILRRGSDPAALRQRRPPVGPPHLVAWKIVTSTTSGKRPFEPGMSDRQPIAHGRSHHRQFSPSPTSTICSKASPTSIDDRAGSSRRISTKCAPAPLSIRPKWKRDVVICCGKCVRRSLERLADATGCMGKRRRPTRPRSSRGILWLQPTPVVDSSEAGRHGTPVVHGVPASHSAGVLKLWNEFERIAPESLTRCLSRFRSRHISWCHSGYPPDRVTVVGSLPRRVNDDTPGRGRRFFVRKSGDRQRNRRAGSALVTALSRRPGRCAAPRRNASHGSHPRRSGSGPTLGRAP